MTHASMTKSLFSAALLLAGFALAQPAPGQGMGRGPGPHRGPPPEAVQACANLQAGTACAFTLNGQNVTGRCTATPKGDVACRPENMPPPGGMGMGMGPHRGPPQEAIAACASLSADAACSFTIDGQAMTGACAQRRNGSGLVCHPAGMGPGMGRGMGAGGGQCGGQCDGGCGMHGGMGMGPGRHGPPAEALAACKNLSASTACSFQGKNGQTIQGTCLNRPMGGEMVCHPNGVPMGIGRMGPPQESVDACQGKAANAACSFTSPHGETMSGTCFAPPNGQGLACRPSWNK